MGNYEFVKWAGFLQLTFLDTSGGVCLFPIGPFAHETLSMVLPLVAFPLLGLTAVIHYISYVLCCKKRARQIQDFSGEGLTDMRAGVDDSRANSSPNGLRRIPFLGRFSIFPYYRSVLALFVFSFNSVVTQSLRYFSCSDLVDGKTYLVVKPAIECGTTAYKQLLVLPIVLLVSYFLISCVLLSRLIYLHWQQVLQRRAVRRVWGVLFEPFGKHRFYWVGMVLMRQLTYVMIVVFVEHKHDRQYAAATVAGVMFLLVHMFSDPYRHTEENRWETVSLVFLVLITTALTANPNATVLALLVLPFGIALGVKTFLIKVSQAYNLWRTSGKEASDVEPKPPKYRQKLSDVLYSSSDTETHIALQPHTQYSPSSSLSLSAVDSQLGSGHGELTRASHLDVPLLSHD
ncbi:MAG: hypothetical protein P1U78_13940 [Alcanivoracaceae bacterium]|nr:hypothetical protein [Alcanivoracaceae bacterium]